MAEILSDIERRGEPAVRDWSLRLDGWAPESFVVGSERSTPRPRRVPDELKAHIAFAQEQVRGFAERQRATLADLDVETLRASGSATGTSRSTPSAPTCPAGATRWSRRRS